MQSLSINTYTHNHYKIYDQNLDEKLKKLTFHSQMHFQEAPKPLFVGSNLLTYQRQSFNSQLCFDILFLLPI
jgi:hypothetical protein